jgi:hypothetical protein
MFLAVAASLLFVTIAPVEAQQYRGSGNNVIGTIGDLPTGKVTSRTSRSFGLNYSRLGLFGDAEVYPVYDGPNPYIYPLPSFGSRQDYTGISFEEYLEQVAKSYGHSVERYLSEFTFQNEYSMANGVPLYEGFQDLSQVAQYYRIGGLELIKTYFPDYASDNADELFKKISDEALKRVHENDFRAGGGFLPLGDPIDPQDVPPTFEPLPNDGTIGPDGEPYEPLPVPGEEDDTDDLNDTAALAAEVAQSSTLDQAAAASLAAETLGLSESSSASGSASVALVPEPATIGLLTLGAGAMLGRRRR